MARSCLVPLSAIALGCAEPAFPIDDTEFKCDAENECPPGYECNGTPGVCGKIGLVGCAGQPYTQSWAFGSSDERWTFTPNAMNLSSAGLTWVDDDGYPELGALAVDIVLRGQTTSNLGQFQSPGPHGDMRAKFVSARLWTAASGITVKPYLRSSGQSWSDGGTTSLQPNEWTCATFEVDSTNAFRTQDFDVTNVTTLGLEVGGLLDADVPVRVLLDDAGY